jgi:paraquat-inducible protein B
LRDALTRAVDNGLRASLETANLLTGSLYVNLDFFASARSSAPDEFAGYPAIPAVSTGLGRLQQQLSELMTKLNTLPVEESVTAANATMVELRAATRELRTLLASDAIRTLPARLDASLVQLDRTLSAYSADSGLPEQLSRAVTELNRTLESVRSVADTLERDPSAVIFPTRHAADPRPEAGAP